MTFTVPPQNGKTFFITGANSGLGLAAAKLLTAHGARVLVGCRDAQKGNAAVAAIKAATPAAIAELVQIDLASLASIRAAAQKLADRGEAIDVLINNAGIMAIPRDVTVDGFERQFGTNHLGHFALTGLVLPLFKKGARVINVSSLMHRRGRLSFDDLQGERGYSKWGAYANSKLANLLFTGESDRRLRAHGIDALSAAAHPGYASTNLQAVGPRAENSRLMMRFTDLGNRLIAQSAEAGALPEVYAATMPDVVGGALYGPSGWFELRGTPKRVAASARADDAGDAKSLWEMSAKLTGVNYL